MWRLKKKGMQVDQSLPRSGQRVSSSSRPLRVLVGMLPTTYASRRTVAGINAACNGEEQLKLDMGSFSLARCGNASETGKRHHLKAAQQKPNEQRIEANYPLNAIPNANATHLFKAPYILLQVYLESRILPYPLPVLVENPRGWTHSKRNKSKQRIAPAETESIVHFLAGQWQ